MKTGLTLYDYSPESVPPRWLFREEGSLVYLSGNHPLLLDDPSSVWIVSSGRADVFSVRLYHGRIAGTRHRLFRVEMGQVLFGLQLSGNGWETGLLVSSVPGTTLLKLPRSRLMALSHDPDFGGDIIRLVEDWVNEISAAAGQVLSPKDFESLEAGQEISIPENRSVFPQKGVLWIKHLDGSSQFMNCQTPIGADDPFLPITRHTWLHTVAPCRLDAVDTRTFVRQDPHWAGLTGFHALLLNCLNAANRETDHAEAQRLKEQERADRQTVENALSRLASVLKPEADRLLLEDERDPLLTACRWVGDALGLTIRPYPTSAWDQAQQNPLENIAHASHIRVRRVMLRKDWWRQDNGPLLAYMDHGDEQRPVALLPTSPARYELRDPAARTRVPVTAQVARRLANAAYSFYRPFPARALTAWDLWKFGLRGVQSDLWMVLVMSAAAGMLGLVVPLATGWIFKRAIPLADQSLLTQVFWALAIGALASALFQFTPSIAILRTETRMAASIQAATWDRLLSLPVPFFRHYSAGDLSARAMGVDTIRQKLAGTTITTLLVGVFSTFNLALMFYYDSLLAWMGIGLVLIALAVTAWMDYLQVHKQRLLAHMQGRLTGVILQLVSGIAKLRVSGAEGRAFAFWAKHFSEQKRLDYQVRTIANGLTTFNAIYPLLNLTFLFLAIVLAGGGSARLSASDLVAFYAAFSQFLAAGLQLSTALTAIWDIVPVYERARPILQTVPEVDDTKSDPGELTGEIEAEHVHFKYKPDGPSILQDVSMYIAPGEFVALVGPSGSGKSTLFRLLLGFEVPESGTILYDKQNLTELDIWAVRRQIGVVLQHNKLTSGNLLSNIIGSSPLTVQDAWEAARMVGLDKDIERMPMGMYTVVGQGGGTLSGGQRQRVLIARAIVHKPRILFFDEATSALDNTTQAIVSKSLDLLQATRIVIAHRLSTILKADRIFVLDKGRIAQSGTFEDLSKEKGLFANLAARQLL